MLGHSLVFYIHSTHVALRISYDYLSPFHKPCKWGLVRLDHLFIITESRLEGRTGQEVGAKDFQVAGDLWMVWFSRLMSSAADISYLRWRLPLEGSPESLTTLSTILFVWGKKRYKGTSRTQCVHNPEGKRGTLHLQRSGASSIVVMRWLIRQNEFVCAMLELNIISKLIQPLLLKIWTWWQ